MHSKHQFYSLKSYLIDRLKMAWSNKLFHPKCYKNQISLSHSEFYQSICSHEHAQLLHCVIFHLHDYLRPNIRAKNWPENLKEGLRQRRGHKWPNDRRRRMCRQCSRTGFALLISTMFPWLTNVLRRRPFSVNAWPAVPAICCPPFARLSPEIRLDPKIPSIASSHCSCSSDDQMFSDWVG